MYWNEVKTMLTCDLESKEIDRMRQERKYSSVDVTYSQQIGICIFLLGKILMMLVFICGFFIVTSVLTPFVWPYDILKTKKLPHINHKICS